MKTKTLIIALALSAVALCSCGQQPTTEAETQKAPAKTEQVDNYTKYNAMSFEVTDKGMDEFGYHHFDVKITNNGDFTATLVSPVICFVDADGNTLTTSSVQVQGNLKPGTFTVEDAFSGGEFCDVTQIANIVIENYDYYTVGETPECYVNVNTVSEKADVYEVDS